MKRHLLLVAMAILLTQLSYAQKGWGTIGSVHDGKTTLTIDKAATLKAYNANLLKHSGIDGQFTDFKLWPIEGGNYALVFSGTTYKSTFFVKAEGTDLRAMLGTSCTTTDCSSEPRGCIVKYDGGDIGYCSPCANEGKCTKTSTSEELF